MSTRVYVGGLSYKVRETDIEYFFRKYGKLREISMKNGFAFIEFDDYREADDACYDLNGREFMGSKVSVEIARGTPHGRDKERWGYGSGRDRRRDRTPGISKNYVMKLTYMPNAIIPRMTSNHRFSYLLIGWRCNIR